MTGSQLPLSSENVIGLVVRVCKGDGADIADVRHWIVGA